MAVESAADRAEFVNTDDFGEAATFDGSTTVNGIFDGEYRAVIEDGDVATVAPRFTCRSADVSSPIGKSLVVDGTTYTIRDDETDGTGFTVLHLEKQ